MSSVTPAREFTCFPNLLPELKLKIWGLSHPSPRIIRVCHMHAEDTEMRRTYQVVAKTPAILSINQESRAEGLEQYTIIHGGKGVEIAYDPRCDMMWYSALQGATTPSICAVPDPHLLAEKEFWIEMYPRNVCFERWEVGPKRILIGKHAEDIKIAIVGVPPREELADAIIAHPALNINDEAQYELPGEPSGVLTWFMQKSKKGILGMGKKLEEAPVVTIWDGTCIGPDNNPAYRGPGRFYRMGYIVPQEA